MLELRTYQQEDAAFLASLPCSACFNEQRTGKTPTALEVVKLKGLIDERILIVTTASSVYQWQKEYETWLGKPCVTCSGTPKQKQKQLEQWTHGLVISIDSFKSTNKSNGLIEPILALQPKMMILDEAHKIKNPKTANAKAVFKTTKIPNRIALTGTPAQGKAYDVYSILKFLFPVNFKGFWKFIDDFFIIKQETIYVAGRPRTIMTYENFKQGKKEELQDLLNTFSTQRKRKEVMPWLPDKFYEQVKLNPTKEQQKYLKELSETYKTGDIVTKGTLDRLIRYRQICLAPALLGLDGKSPKTEFIKQYIKDNPDESILIFSKFTSYLHLLSKELNVPWAMLVGDTPLKTRDKFIRDFQDKKFKVFLLNIDAAKEALTLDAADTTIFADKYPPIGDIQQAEDRFIASVKEKAHKTHKIVELMIKDTFDEQLYILLEQRKDETDIINNYKYYIERRKKDVN